MTVRATLMFLTVMLLGIAATQTAQPALAQQATAPQPISLYAHVSPSGRLVLNATQLWSGIQTREIRQPLQFQLTPTLGSSLRLFGSVTIQAYIRGETQAIGTIRVALDDSRPDGTSVPIVRVDSPQTIDTRILSFPVIYGSINYTLSQGSTLILSVQYDTQNNRSKPVLVFDDPRFPTKVALPVIEPVRFDLTVSDGGPVKEKPLFSTNGTFRGRVSLLAALNLTDPFGLYRLTNLTVTVTETRTQRTFPLDQLRQHAQTPYSRLLTQNFTTTQGSYEMTALIVDISQNRYQHTSPFWVSPFYDLKLRILDPSTRPVENARVTLGLPFASFSNVTDQDGVASYLLPSSGIVGGYEVSITWKEETVAITGTLEVSGPTSPTFVFPIYDYALTLHLLFIPLPGSSVELIRGDQVAARGITSPQGTVAFGRIHQGIYTLRIYYLGTFIDQTIVIDQNKSALIIVPVPYQNELAAGFILILAMSVATLVVRSRTRLYRAPFAYFNALSNGGLPTACVATILGNSGSGKTSMMQMLVAESLNDGRACILVVNSEFPDTVRQNMTELGMNAEEFEKEGRLVFIDCYSGFSGQASKEKYQVSSATDLTTLGIRISTCLEELGERTDVYLDSLTPMLTTLKDDYVLAFVQSLGAKTKANRGRFIASLGTSVDKSSIVKVEESSDCVIETQLVDARAGQQRRMRIKKLRGKGYVDKWTRFIVEPKGIVYFSPKPYPEQT